jgi:hypothetical protein
MATMVKVTVRHVLEKAVQKLGSRTDVAKAIGVKRQAFDQWEKDGQVPAKRVLAMERISGVSRYDMRPDIYGAAPPGPGGRVRPKHGVPRTPCQSVA